MANNNQLTYQTATIDPTIAGYASRDPGFALGLMLGRGLVNNYNERGERKLRESLLNGDGTLGGNGGQANTTNPSATATGQDGGATSTPQIFAANENPIMAAVPKYTIDTNGASQPMTDVQRAVVENAVSGQNPTQGNSLKDRAYAILHDPNNAWAQSAARGAIYNQLAAQGVPGNGNPYAIGNYNDPARNYSEQALANSLVARNTPVYNVQNGAVQQGANNYATNPLQGMGNYAINTGATPQINGIDPSTMTLAQLQSFVNGETPQTAPVLDAVQNAQQKEQIQAQAMQNLQNIKLNNPVNFTKAEQEESKPVQQPNAQKVDVAKNATTTPTISKVETVQNPMLSSMTSALPTINTANGTVAPFTTKDWIARVTQAGLAQGRPLNQIQNVIAQTMPMAQAAEDNYRNTVTNALSNRILQGDETTGGVPLIPNGQNDNQVLPQLLSTIQQLEQVNPDAATRMRQILPGAKDIWTQNVGNINKARDVAYSRELAQDSLKNNIAQHKAYADIDIDKSLELAKQQFAFADAKQKAIYSTKFNMLKQAGYGDKEAAVLAMGIRGTGTGTGTNGSATVDGRALTKSQQTKMEDLSANITDLSNNLDDAMKNAKKGSDQKDFGAAIANLQTYLENLKGSEKALIPKEVMDRLQQQMYAANYRREYLAGNTGKAAQYLKALTQDARARYGIN